MIRLEAGVRISGIRQETVLGIVIAGSVYAAVGEDMTVTSVIDGQHMRASIHYSGGAFDIRLPRLNREAHIVAKLGSTLGRDYDVVLEKDHIHVEFQPKEPINRGR